MATFPNFAIRQVNRLARTLRSPHSLYYLGHHWVGKRLLFHCDNQAVSDPWARGSSRCPALMVLVCCLFFSAAAHNYTVVIRHFPGSATSNADALSRSQMGKFLALAPLAAQLPSLPLEAHTLGRPACRHPTS